MQCWKKKNQAFRQAKTEVESIQQFEMSLRGVKEINFSKEGTKAFQSIIENAPKLDLTAEELSAVKKASLGGAEFTYTERQALLSASEKFETVMSEEFEKCSNKIFAHKENIQKKEDELEKRKDSANPPTKEEIKALETEKEQLQKELHQVQEDKSNYHLHSAMLRNSENEIRLTEGEQHLANANFESDMNLSAKLENLEALTVDDMLTLQENFIKKAEAQGFQFVKVDGKFDIKALEKLTSSQMAQLEIDDSMKNLLVQSSNPQLLKSNLEKEAFGATKAIFQKFDDSEDWQEVFSTVDTFKRTYKYTTQASTAVYRFTQMRVNDIVKARHEKSATANSSESVAKSVETQTAPTTGAVNHQRNERFLARQQLRKERMEHFQNTRIGKFYKRTNELKEEAIKRVSQSKVGQFAMKTKQFLIKWGLKLAGYAGIASFVTAFFLVTAIIIMTSVQSLLDAMNPSNVINNMLAPKTYEDTVAYNLYNMMKADEENWLYKDVSDFELAYSDRKNRKYGKAYMDYEGYINTIGQNGKMLRIGDDGETLYINPFSGGSDSLVKYDDMTQVSAFDGNNIVALHSNSNIYTQTTSADETDFDSAGQNGHTSNIKDIIAMTDVMFGMALDENDDMTASSILGESKESIEWNRSFLAQALKWFGSKFTGEEYHWKTKEESLSYEMIEQYAGNLFDASHQENSSFSIEYYNPLPSNPKGTYMDNGTQTDVASKLGVCTNPVKKKFRIDWNSGNITPYLTKEDDNKLFLSDAENQIQVTMENCADWYNGYGTAGDNPEGCCLWTGLNGEPNSNTEYWIQRNANLVEGYSGGSGCWKLESDDTVRDTEHYSDTGIGGLGSFWGNYDDTHHATLWDFYGEGLNRDADIANGAIDWCWSQGVAKPDTEYTSFQQIGII